MVYSVTLSTEAGSFSYSLHLILEGFQPGDCWMQDWFPREGSVCFMPCMMGIYSSYMGPNRAILIRQHQRIPAQGPMPEPWKSYSKGCKQRERCWPWLIRLIWDVSLLGRFQGGDKESSLPAGLLLPDFSPGQFPTSFLAVLGWSLSSCHAWWALPRLLLPCTGQCCKQKV